MQNSESLPESLRPANCPAYVMAGGLSSRFGSDKARVEVACVDDRVEGACEPLLLALRRSLSGQGHAVEIVADRVDRYEDLGLQCLVDQQPGQGPLAGVATALQHCEQRQPGWLLLVSCDLFVWRAEWFESLAGNVKVAPAALSQPACDAIAFVSDTKDQMPTWEPFPSLLHTHLLPQVAIHLQLGQRSMQTLFRASRTFGIQTQDNPQSWTFNTVEQLRALRYPRMI